MNEMYKELKDIYAKLSAHFPVKEIGWRVGSTNAAKTHGIALAYIDARDVMKRLDDVMGFGNWSNRDRKDGDTYYCQLSLKLPCDNSLGYEWVEKTGAAGATDFEAEKGGASDAFKRAGVLWGIGRYLYYIDSPWVEIESSGKSYKIKDKEYSKLEKLLAGEPPIKSGLDRDEKNAVAEIYYDQVKRKINEVVNIKELEEFGAVNTKSMEKYLNSDQLNDIRAIYKTKLGGFKNEQKIKS